MTDTPKEVRDLASKKHIRRVRFLSHKQAHKANHEKKPFGDAITDRDNALAERRRMLVTFMNRKKEAE